MPTKIIGTAPYQVPRNSDLGTLAVQDLDNVNIQGGAVALGASSTQGYFQNTDVSEVKPSLLLDFANGRTLDPRVSFFRSSTATYYDGCTSAKAEENLVTYSQQFDNAAWQKIGSSIVANTTIAPDGTVTAATISGVSGVAPYLIGQAGVTSGVTYTMSVYAKSCSSNFVQIAGQGFYGVDVWANFNLSTGAVGSVGALTTASIQSIGNGWYRCIVTGAATSSGSINSFAILPVDSATSARMSTASSNISVYIWGAQKEQRSGAGGYVQTTSTAITNYVPQLQTAASGVPRFDHDPITGESKGLLIEEQRTNLMPYSEALGYWAKYGNVSVINDATIAPNGSLTADQILCSSTGTTSFVNQNMPTGITAPCTCSAYVKSTTGNRVGITSRTGSYPYQVLFDLTGSGSVVATYGSAITNTGITPVGNGWYRVWVSLTNCEQMNIHVLPQGFTSSTFDFSAGTVTPQDWIYAWGAQVETGSHVTSYIPTTSSQATRSSESALTSINWYNFVEGTVYAEANMMSVAAKNYQRIFSIHDSTTSSSYVCFDTYGSTIRGLVSSGTSFSITPQSGYNKYTLAYKVNDFSTTLNGSSLQTASSGYVPSNLVQAGVGSTSQSGNTMNGWIKKIAYYPKRLSNAELLEITL